MKFEQSRRKKQSSNPSNGKKLKTVRNGYKFSLVQKVLFGFGLGLVVTMTGTVGVLQAMGQGKTGNYETIIADGPVTPHAKPVQSVQKGNCSEPCKDAVFAQNNWSSYDKTGTARQLPIKHEELETKELIHNQNMIYLDDSFQGLSVTWGQEKKLALSEK